MRRSTIVIALSVALAGAAVAAPVALGKEGVRARLEAPLATAAPPGSSVRIVWTLSYVDGGKRRPFGAHGLFVILSSASGGAPTKAYGRGSAGRFRAHAAVPDGGIGGIRFGLEGTRYVGGGPGQGQAQDAPVYFPLDDDPFQRLGGPSPGSIWPAIVAALRALGLP